MNDTERVGIHRNVITDTRSAFKSKPRWTGPVQVLVSLFAAVFLFSRATDAAAPDIETAPGEHREESDNALPQDPAVRTGTLEDWGHRMALEGRDIERERSVIVEEWRLGLGASRRLREQQFPILLKDSRYAERLPIGDIELIRTFEPDVLERFYEDWYRPDLMAVVAVGDFDGDRVEQWIHRHFGRMERPEDPRTRPSYEIPGHEDTLFAPAADPEQPDTRVSIYNKADIPSVHTEEQFRELLANRLYSTMINQRFSELVQQPGVTLTRIAIYN